MSNFAAWFYLFLLFICNRTSNNKESSLRLCFNGTFFLLNETYIHLVLISRFVNNVDIVVFFPDFSTPFHWQPKSQVEYLPYCIYLVNILRTSFFQSKRHIPSICRLQIKKILKKALRNDYMECHMQPFFLLYIFLTHVALITEVNSDITYQNFNKISWAWLTVASLHLLLCECDCVAQL